MVSEHIAEEFKDEEANLIGGAAGDGATILVFGATGGPAGNTDTLRVASWHLLISNAGGSEYFNTGNDINFDNAKITPTTGPTIRAGSDPILSGVAFSSIGPTVIGGKTFTLAVVDATLNGTGIVGDSAIVDFSWAGLSGELFVELQ